MPKKKSKRNRARNPANAKPKMGDVLIAQANTSYSHPAISTAATIAIIAVICSAVGATIAFVLELIVDDKAKMTWQIAIYIAIITALFRVALSVANSIIMIPLVTRITRRMIQRRTGVIIEDSMIEKAIDENEQPSRIGPAAIAAAASFFICLQYDAPYIALILVPAGSAAVSPVVAHLTDHRTIRTLWKGAKGQYFKATTRRSK